MYNTRAHTDVGDMLKKEVSTPSKQQTHTHAGRRKYLHKHIHAYVRTHGLANRFVIVLAWHKEGVAKMTSTKQHSYSIHNIIEPNRTEQNRAKQTQMRNEQQQQQQQHHQTKYISKKNQIDRH